VCILRFCARNESCKRVYYKNDRFFSRFLCGKYDNVLSDDVYPEAKTVFYWDFNVNTQYIGYSVKNQDTTMEWKYNLWNLTLIWKKTRGQKSQENVKCYWFVGKHINYVCMWLDDILQEAYKFKKWRLHYLSEL
jgi:hypothetical protein